MALPTIRFLLIVHGLHTIWVKSGIIISIVAILELDQLFCWFALMHNFLRWKFLLNDVFFVLRRIFACLNILLEVFLSLRIQAILCLGISKIFRDHICNINMILNILNLPYILQTSNTAIVRPSGEIIILFLFYFSDYTARSCRLKLILLVWKRII